MKLLFFPKAKSPRCNTVSCGATKSFQFLMISSCQFSGRLHYADVIMVEMGIGDDPGFGGDDEGGVGKHSLIIMEKSFNVRFLTPTSIPKISRVFVRQFLTTPGLDRWVCVFPVPNTGRDEPLPLRTHIIPAKVACDTFSFDRMICGGAGLVKVRVLKFPSPFLKALISCKPSRISWPHSFSHFQSPEQSSLRCALDIIRHCRSNVK